MLLAIKDYQKEYKDYIEKSWTGWLQTSCLSSHKESVKNKANTILVLFSIKLPFKADFKTYKDKEAYSSLNNSKALEKKKR